MSDSGTPPPNRGEILLRSAEIRAEQDAVVEALKRNRRRRERAEAETNAARAELRALLIRGDLAVLQVAHMARLASISRDTAHRYLGTDAERRWRTARAQRKAKEGDDG